MVIWEYLSSTLYNLPSTCPLWPIPLCMKHCYHILQSVQCVQLYDPKKEMIKFGVFQKNFTYCNKKLLNISHLIHLCHLTKSSLSPIGKCWKVMFMTQNQDAIKPLKKAKLNDIKSACKLKKMAMTLNIFH